MADPAVVNLLDVLAELQELPPEHRSPRIDQLGLSAAQRRQLAQWLAAGDGAGSFLERTPNLVRDLRLRPPEMAAAMGSRGDGVGSLPIELTLTGDSPAFAPAPKPSDGPTVVERNGDPCPHAAARAGEARCAAMRPAESIGPYRLLSVLGEGGMGVVYKAEQRQPIRRMVAVKLVKPGFDTREVVARFEAERQALALMDHPNIAKVLDAGATDAGRPFFVMEYVPGVPLPRFCDENRLTIGRRLELFTQACEAIAHAHSKAVLHRDVKPSNVLAYLLEGRPVVKVIDFGVAKALTSERLTDRTYDTGLGQVIGTYDSMSPEQAHGSPDVDTRTDVYALGVLLYELLVGAKPFDRATFGRAAEHEIRRIIREVDPPRPSTRLSGLGDTRAKVAAARQVGLEALAKELRTELEWIPLKAMRKERDRRYAGPLQLADDVRNYLAGRPLLAAPESSLYRGRKWLGRNRRSVAVAAMILAGAATASGLYVRAVTAERARTLAALDEARRQRAEATAAAASLGAVHDFLVDDVLGAADPAVQRGRELSVREALDGAARRVDLKFAGQPLVGAAVRHTLAQTYGALGRADLGVPHAAAAVERRRLGLGPDHRDTLASVDRLAYLLRMQGRSADAEPLLREAVDRGRRALGADDPQTLTSADSLGCLLYATGRLPEAESCLTEVVERRRRALGDGHPDTLFSVDNLGYVLRARGRLPEAESMLREAMGRGRRAVGDDHPRTLALIDSVGGALRGQGRLAEAEPLLREAVAGRQQVLGPDHPETLASMYSLFHLLHAQGKTAEAEPLLREVVGRRRRVLPPDHPDLLFSLDALGAVLLAQGKPSEAEPLLAEMCDRAVAGAAPAATSASYLRRHADCLVRIGRRSDAEARLRKAQELEERANR